MTTLNDNDIIELYFARSENAITETDKKYGTYCRKITFGVLGNTEDSEECVDDTYMKLWNAIPPQRPMKLAVYIASVARHIALNMRRRFGAAKRGGDAYETAYDEIAECVRSNESVEGAYDEKELIEILNRFLASLDTEKQQIFMKRYWHFRSIAEIADELHISQEKVKTTLHRTREKLRSYLENEGVRV